MECKELKILNLSKNYIRSFNSITKINAKNLQKIGYCNNLMEFEIEKMNLGEL